MRSLPAPAQPAPERLTFTEATPQGIARAIAENEAARDAQLNAQATFARWAPGVDLPAPSPDPELHHTGNLWPIVRGPEDGEPLS